MKSQKYKKYECFVYYDDVSRFVIVVIFFNLYLRTVGSQREGSGGNTCRLLIVFFCYFFSFQSFFLSFRTNRAKKRSLILFYLHHREEFSQERMKNNFSILPFNPFSLSLIFLFNFNSFILIIRISKKIQSTLNEPFCQ